MLIQLLLNPAQRDHSNFKESTDLTSCHSDWLWKQSDEQRSQKAQHRWATFAQKKHQNAFFSFSSRVNVSDEYTHEAEYAQIK